MSAIITDNETQRIEEEKERGRISYSSTQCWTSETGKAPRMTAASKPKEEDTACNATPLAAAAKDDAVETSYKTVIIVRSKDKLKNEKSYVEILNRVKKR